MRYGPMKLYGFDGVDERLDLVPLAARRALDRAGLKLSLDGWRSLSLEARRAIVQAGSGSVVDITPVTASAQRAQPPPQRIEPIHDPPADAPPSELRAAGTESLAAAAQTWATLSPLDRYALAKVAAQGRPELLQAACDEIMGAGAGSTHLNPAGEVHMASVAQRDPTLRRAVAESRISMNTDALVRFQSADAPKGNVGATARIAGILAAKRTAELIPLCHSVHLTQVDVDLAVDQRAGAVRVVAEVEAFARTSVETHALLAASAAALVIYDMLKAFDRAMQVGPTRIIALSGGRTEEPVD
jgi:molybdenum cofactor biosynthesis protein MoaC